MMLQIEPMTARHADAVLRMMREFYASPAVLTDGSEEIFRENVRTCLSGGPYLEGFVFTQDGAPAGYAILAKSFSTEFGKPCVWIEDLYLTPPHRGRGFAATFLAFLEARFPNVIFRLEAEPDNASALRAYRKSGFCVLPYTELKKEPGSSASACEPPARS